MSKGTPGVRHAEVYRETRETKVYVNLGFDGGSKQDIKTGVGFFDHMLQQLAFHGRIDLGVSCEGDLHIDEHHSVEDVGITMGQAMRKALVDSSVERFASLHASMDDALVLVAVDLSGRGYLGWDVAWGRERIGDLSTECVMEFFRSLSLHGGFNLHVRRLAGLNDHHVCEAIFKGVGVVLHRATRSVERKGVSSTKGVIE